MRVFITGGSGCVGHYLVREFLADPSNELVLLLRTPGKLTLPDNAGSRVTVLQGDLTDGARLLHDQGRFDLAILAATAWGGARTFDVTVDANLALADQLIGDGCERIIYFATASVMSRDLELIEEARDHGTAYIRAKHKLVSTIETRANAARIIGFFPTVVFGGGEAPVNAPRSHLVRMLFENKRWLPLLRRLSANGRLHLIHPADIARLAVHFATAAQGDGPERIVLGNAPNTVDELIAAVATATGHRHRPIFRVTENRVEFVAKVLRLKMTPWDLYNARNTDQSYPSAVKPSDFGLPMEMADIHAGLRAVGFAKT
ncbi:MAG: NAD(P)-dependent oxidoreductase [Pseudomonadota bacterium]